MSLVSPPKHGTSIADKPDPSGTVNVSSPWRRWFEQISQTGTASKSFGTQVTPTKVSTGYGMQAPLATRNRLLITVQNLGLTGTAYLMRSTSAVPGPGIVTPSGDVQVATLNGDSSINDQPLAAQTQYWYYVARANSAAVAGVTLTVTEF
jgi:hypothetical protein